MAAREGSAKKSKEIYNYVVLKVTNVHHVKVNEQDEVNGTHVHAVFQVCCIGSILLLLISI